MKRQLPEGLIKEVGKGEAYCWNEVLVLYVLLPLLFKSQSYTDYKEDQANTMEMKKEGDRRWSRNNFPKFASHISCKLDLS